MISKWLLSRSPIEQNKLGELSLIHSAKGIHFYANSDASIIRTSFGFFLLEGYILPRCSEDLEYNSTAELIWLLWQKFGLEWKDHVKGYFSIVAFFDENWIVLNDTLGLSKIYWTKDENQISNSFDSLVSILESITWNESALLSRQYFHRDIGEITILGEVKKSRSGIQLVLSHEKFHRDYYFEYSQLKSFQIDETCRPLDFVGIWKQVFPSMEKFAKNAHHVITLTGGKDARTGLALLKHFGKHVVGMTYGVPDSKDAIFASQLADAARIDHVIPPVLRLKEQWKDQVQSCVDTDSYYISPHRALRGHALSSVMNKKDSPWYWAGYMGGEWLMGLYPDGLVFPKWITNMKLNQSIAEIVFKGYSASLEVKDLAEEVDRLQSLVNTARDEKELQFIWMFEIGVLHHAQDLELAANSGGRPYPFMMDIDFIEKLFHSKYSFFFQDHATKNLLKRWRLYEWNIRIQDALMPSWGNVAFGKKGEYTPRVFLRGSLYWSIHKALHFVFERKKYPSSFTYTEEWRQMYLEFLTEAERLKIPFYSNEDILLLRNELVNAPLPRVEKSWLTFSRMVMVYLQYDKICRIRNGSQYHHPQK